MRKNYIAILCSVLILAAACKKDNAPAPLPDGSVSLQYPTGKDTIELPLSLLKDTTLVLKLTAALTGAAATEDHWVKFAVDTTKIADFRAKYGAALLLPTYSYYFYKSMTRLAAGTSVTDTAELNIVEQLKLKGYSTYVLPVVIKSVDGDLKGPATKKVLYFVFKTGKPLVISKDGWTIAGFSSVNGTFAATNILDANNTTTYWTSGLTGQMPQWVSINFNTDVIFSGLTYYLPTALGYPANGGYPTSIKIETSMNGTNWTDKGTYAGNIVSNSQSINIGLTTARYLRFTVLTSVKYASTYEAIFIAGISLIP